MASCSNNKPTKVVSQKQEGSKSTKTDLMALYRMDFYKNKKNWKLSDDVKKEPPRFPSPTSQSKKLKLGESYNLEPEMEPMNLKPESPHNKAFLHEKSAVIAPDIEPALGPELLMPVAPAPDNLCQLTSVDQSWPKDNSEVVRQDTQQEWCGVEAEGGQDESADLAACPRPSWPPVNPVCTYAECEPKYLSQGQMMKLANDWLEEHGYPLDQEEYVPEYKDGCGQRSTMAEHAMPQSVSVMLQLLETSADFMRGAHRVPHSSEIDLSVQHECWAMRLGAASDLSGDALVAAAHAHAAALRALLAEHALRETLRFTPNNMSLPIPLEEFPSRGPDSPRLPDILVSGSHRPPDTGRGRGRLHTERHAGVAVGRPYRP